MVYQNASNIEVVIAQQAGRGTLASTSGTAYYLPVNPGNGMTLAKANIESAAIRSDGQTLLPRHGSKSSAGAYEIDLGQQHLDMLIQGVMRGAWGSALTLGTNGTIAGTASNGLLIFGSGNPVALGVRAGMVARFAGLTGSGTANNAKNLRVLAADGTSITVPANEIVNFGPVQDLIITVPGRYVLNGTTERYFTVEERESDIDSSIVHGDVKVTGIDLQMQPDAMVKATANLMGRGLYGTYTGGASPYFTAGTQFTGLGLVTSDMVLRLNGTDIADLTGISLKIEPGGQGQPVIGTALQADVFLGLLKVSGQLSGIRTDFAKLGNFLAEDTISLSVLMRENEGEPTSFQSLYIGQLKLNTNGKNFAQSGPMIETIDFMAGVDLRGTGSGYARTTVLWQTEATVP